MNPDRAKDVDAKAWGDGTSLTEIPEALCRAYPVLAAPIALRTLSGGLLHRRFLQLLFL